MENEWVISTYYSIREIYHNSCGSDGYVWKNFGDKHIKCSKCDTRPPDHIIFQFLLLGGEFFARWK